MKKLFKKFNFAHFSIFLLMFCLSAFFKQNIALATDYNQFKTFSFSAINTSLKIGGNSKIEIANRTQSNVFAKKQLPNIEIGDNVVYQNDSKNFSSNSPDFISDTKINFDLSNLDSNYHFNDNSKVKYGGFLQLQSEANSVGKKQAILIDKSYVYAQFVLGKIEIGNNYAVNSKMKVGTASFARGAGGINGNYLNYVNYPIFLNISKINSAVCNIKNADCFNIKFSNFIVLPQSPIAHGGYAHGFYNVPDFNNYNFNKNKDNSLISDGSFGTLKNATKINYYTPRISGWQLGLSLTPETQNNGFSAKIANNNDINLSKVISYGLNYSNNFDNLGLALSATAEQGNYKQKSSLNLDKQNLQAYDFGLTTTYFGLTFGASYGNWGSSLQPKSGVYSCGYSKSSINLSQNCQYNNSFSEKIFSNASYYTAGLAYQFGHFATSITYLNSNFQNNDYNALSFGADYKLTKYLTFYLELTKYQFKSNQLKALNISNQNDYFNDRRLINNQGYVVLTGLSFSF